jgi:hypothetical protein
MGHLQRNVFPSILPILLSLVSLFGYSVFKVLDNHYVTAKVELLVQATQVASTGIQLGTGPRLRKLSWPGASHQA